MHVRETEMKQEINQIVIKQVTNTYSEYILESSVW